MQIGVHVPQVGKFAKPGVIAPFAKAADEAGFASLWVFDHVVLQRDQESKYPYSPDGKMGFAPTNDFIEPLILLTYLAGITTKVRLGSSVLVLPMRQPVLHAKMLASMDHLSGGRMILGGGVGWWKQEFEVLGVPWEQRGKRTDEWLQLVRALWTEEFVDFRGEFYECVDWACNPKPVNGDIPIWLGGESKRQLERIGRLADGWHATAKSLPTLKEEFAVAQEAAEQAGRDPKALSLSVEGGGMLSSEDVDRAADSLARMAELGVQHAIVAVHPREFEQAPAILERFASKHMDALAKL